MIKNIFILAGFLFFTSVFSQKTHTVAQGESAYGISKKYGITLDELYKLNPTVKDGAISIGQVLVIKKNGTTTNSGSSVPASSGKLGKIILKPKQTVYGITKQYKISEAELRKLNPNLDSHMKIGDEVVLPLENINKYGDNTSNSDNLNNQAGKNPVENQIDPVVDKKTIAPDDSYIVQEKDNYFKIGRKFGINQKQLFALNPGLEEKGLHAGDVIKVKGTETAETKTTPVTQNTTPAPPVKTVVSGDYVTYTVQSGDTVFGILNRFGISLDELLELNPELTNGLKNGMVLKIRKTDAIYEKKAGDALSVVLMLPFGFDSNDTKYRTLASDFLAGAKLAIERNTRAGLKMDVKVIDAGSENSFKNSLVQINPDNTDIIIGPFFKSNVIEVLDFVKKDKIPVVAPFANSEDLYDYSNLIIVETNEQFYADRIIKEVKDVYSNQKIYIVADKDKTNADYLKNGLEKTLKGAVVTIVNTPSEIQADQNMMTGQSVPVIAILASEDDSKGTAFADRMVELGAETAGIKAFSMFYSPQFEKKADELSTVSLVYLRDRAINTEGSFEKEILADFKEKYCKVPSKYNIIGFDVVNDMLSRENKKGEILKQMGKSQTQLATKFEFERVKPNGAYVNKGYRVVRLLP
ncbi:MAG: LysM peptidoglycan-binding domain-containing protein [Bergeyella sp.]